MIPKYDPDSFPPDFGQALRKHLGVTTQVPNLPAATAFFRSRGICSMWGGTELPSLLEVIGGELLARVALAPPAAMGRVNAWAKSLVASGQFGLVKLFRGRETLVARPLWPAVAELAPSDPEDLWYAGKVSTAARHIAAFLREDGPTDTLDLLRLVPARFPILPRSLKEGLRELEEKLIIYPQRLGERQIGTAFHTWELLHRGLAMREATSTSQATRRAFTCLVEATVRAAGIVDAGEAGRWFPRSKRKVNDAFVTLVEAGKIRGVDEGNSTRFAWPGLVEKPLSVAGCCI